MAGVAICCPASSAQSGIESAGALLLFIALISANGYRLARDRIEAEVQ